jgi:hypothetical protein
MLISDFREEARVLLGTPFADLLQLHSALLWRTHDYGMLRFATHRLTDRQLSKLEKGLGSTHGRHALPDRAALKVHLPYLTLSACSFLMDQPEENGGLAGAGCLVQQGEDLLLFSAEPLAALKTLQDAESRAKTAMMDRVLASKEKTDAPLSIEVLPRHSIESTAAADHACGRCASGLLGGDCDCLGAACVRNGAL